MSHWCQHHLRRRDRVLATFRHMLTAKRRGGWIGIRRGALAKVSVARLFRPLQIDAGPGRSPSACSGKLPKMTRFLATGDMRIDMGRVRVGRGGSERLFLATFRRMPAANAERAGSNSEGCIDKVSARRIFGRPSACSETFLSIARFRGLRFPGWGGAGRPPCRRACACAHTHTHASHAETRAGASKEVWRDERRVVLAPHGNILVMATY